MNQKQHRQLIAEVISIGDEMTSGARLDTNAQWLSRRIGELGVHVGFHSTVGDTLDHNVDVIRAAADRADVVVCTGGLGPTRDDLTREALSIAADQPLEMNESSMQHIASLFARRNREMPQRNRMQAMFPRGSLPIFNPQGTAPGIEMAMPRESGDPSWFFALPGVPAEMERMFDDSVAPRILEQSGGATKIRHLVMKFFGTGESEMERRLGEMISRDRQPRVGITVSAATISLRITATGETVESCDAMIGQTRAEILDRVSEFYFGDGESFEQFHAIDAMLRRREESLMVIELGRAAPLGDWFASLGATPAFRGGVSLATDADLRAMFDVAQLATAVDEAKRRFQVDWALLVDAYPPLDPTGDGLPGTSDVRFVVSSPDGKQPSLSRAMGGHPEILQALIAKTAMAWFRKCVPRQS